MNSYSVFKNDRLVFMMDGDRASVFKSDEVEVISAPEDAEERVYLVGKWLFGKRIVKNGLKIENLGNFENLVSKN